MNNKGLGEKDTRISGICFVLYAVVLFIVSFVTIYSYFSSMRSSDDYAGGWVNLFNIIFLLLTIVFSIIAFGILCFGGLYLVMGIFILKTRSFFGIAIVSFLLSAGYLGLWIYFSSSEYVMYGINPVTAAAAAFFGVLALMLGLPESYSRKRFVKKCWPLPWILLAASVFVSPLQNVFLWLFGGEPDSINVLYYLISVSRLILLFPAYFFGCRWMKKKAEADLL